MAVVPHVDPRPPSPARPAPPATPHVDRLPPRRAPRPPAAGEPQPAIGFATAHHGEILQGIFPLAGGGLERGLVTLPCDLFHSRASFEPRRARRVVVEPADRSKAASAARLVLDRLGAPGLGGRLRIDSTVPVGWGLGSSTCDVTAALRAAAGSLGVRLSPDEVATLAVAAETASDSLMYDRGVLFAQRRGLVLRELGGTLPPLLVLGCNPLPPEAAAIDTLAMPPAAYDWWEAEAFRPLLALLHRGIATRDPRLVGRVASASSRINQRFCPKPRFAELERIAAEHGALGLQVAHSGSVVGLLFDPRDRTSATALPRARRALERLGVSETWTFRVG